MNLQKLMECCEHTRPITVPCASCLGKRLEAEGQQWKNHGRLAAEDEVRQANDRVKALIQKAAKAEAGAEAAIAELKKVQAGNAVMQKEYARMVEEIKMLNAQIVTERNMKILAGQKREERR